MRNRLWIVIVIGIAFAARVWQLDAQSLWNDEGSSYVQATRSFADIATNAAADIHPPGYYWTLRVWRGLTGESEFALRYLSVLAGVMTVAFAYGYGLRLYPSRRDVGAAVGLAGATLVALNTFQVYYSQEARMYAALALWGAASFWALLGLFNRPTWRRALWLGVINALGLWTQYAFPLVMIAQGAGAVLWLLMLLFAWKPKRLWRGLVMYVAGNGLALLLFAPIVQTAIRQVTTWPNTGDTALPPAESVSLLLRWFAFGMTHAHASTNWLAVALLLAVFGLLTFRDRAAWRSLLAALWMGVPLAAFVWMGLYREGNVKFLLPSQVGFALMVGQGVAALWWLVDDKLPDAHSFQTTLRHTQAQRRSDTGRFNLRVWSRALALVMLAGLAWQQARGLVPLYTHPDYQRDDYRAIVAHISTDNAQHGVILNAPGQREVFGYYYGGTSPVLGIPRGLNSPDDEIEADTLNALAQWERIYVLLWGDVERDPRGVVESTLDTHAHEVDNRWYGDVRLASYVAAPEWYSLTREPFARFDNGMRIERYAVDKLTVSGGDVLAVQLNWFTEQPQTERYKVFVQLLDENGQLVASRDSEPVGGTRPTDTWARGETLIDRHGLLLPNNMTGTHFTLIVGLYNPSIGGERVMLDTPDNMENPSDFYTLTDITYIPADEE